MRTGEKEKKYSDPVYTFKVRDKEIKIKTHTESLSHTQIPRWRYQSSSLGVMSSDGLCKKMCRGIPLHCGYLSFKREGEDPTRMFAGEGGPERTNRRFHYVSLGMLAARLSTAFDSVTLYAMILITDQIFMGRLVMLV